MTTALAEPITASLLFAPGFHFSSTGLKIDPSVKFEEWEDVGRKLETAERAVGWWIGDWIRHGEKSYGERYAQAIVDATGRKKQTLMNYAFVAKAFNEPSRRRESVDFSIHAEVASLPEKEQDILLEKAYKSPDVTVREVRKEARRIKKKLKLIPDEIELIHAPEVQEFLTGYEEVLKGLDDHVPSSAVFLRNMIQAHIGQAIWQRDRTVGTDCEAILDLFDDEGVPTATDADIFTWLIRTGHFISDPDLDDRLELMSRHSVLEREALEAKPPLPAHKLSCECSPVNKRLAKMKQGGKKDNQRGDMPDVYMRYNARAGDAYIAPKANGIYGLGSEDEE